MYISATAMNLMKGLNLVDRLASPPLPAAARVTMDDLLIIADRATRKLLGGACVGAEASELIHEIVVAMRFGATARDLATTPHYHPTLSEIWTYPAEELAEL